MDRLHPAQVLSRQSASAVGVDDDVGGDQVCA
jgi:hypothetical protein